MSLWACMCKGYLLVSSEKHLSQTRTDFLEAGSEADLDVQL